jgi:hypothetical protein
MKKLILFFGIMFTFVLGTNTVNAQDNKQEEVLTFIKNADLITKKSSDSEKDTATLISQKIVENSKGAEFPLDVLKKEDTYIVFATNYKKMFVYYFDNEANLKNKFAFRGDFEQKIRTLAMN